jgi:hypothetical protein
MNTLLILLVQVLFKALLKLIKDVFINPLIAYNLELNSSVWPHSSIGDVEIAEPRTSAFASLCCSKSGERRPFLA